jgi:aryl-alcohol dehydrogenase-like predicted oxidoreductase
VRSGKVLAVGISDTPAWLVARAVTLAEERGLTPFCALQIPYSLVERTVERELLPMARALDLAVTGWAPLGGGLLTGRYGSDRERPTDGRKAGRPLPERNLAIADTLNAVAAARGASATQVAIAWLRAQQRRAVTIPIVGVRTEAQIVDNLGAVAIELEPAELERLDEVSRVPLGFPGDFGGARLAHGNTFDRVGDHRGTIDPL